MTKIELAKQALQSLYLEVDSKIADDVKSKVLSALEEARNQGFKNACELLDSMFSKCSTHEYMIGDCLLKKVNLLKGKPRINQGRGEGPVWVKEEWVMTAKHWVSKIRESIASAQYGEGVEYNLSHETYPLLTKFLEWLKEPDKLEQSKKEQ